MKAEILEHLKQSLKALGIDEQAAALEYPEDVSHGDFSTNTAMVNAKKLKTSPRELAEKIVLEFKNEMPECVKEVSIAGAGFINFSINVEYFAKQVIDNANHRSDFTPTLSSTRRGGTQNDQVMVEFTDANPFKEFHIGHLMSNAIGESISRLIEYGGTKVIRANWQGDVGPHVAKAIWGAMHESQIEVSNPVAFWGKAYALGAQAYDTDDIAKKEIESINKKVYDKSDPEINAIYERGRKESLESFEAMYKRLGTKFDNYFFEGTEGRNGEPIVMEHMGKGIFEKSDGAIVFKGENYGLHTRVFITSKGLPTYETKELGLNTEKFKLYPDLVQSIIITGNEQSDYFKVLLKVFELIDQNIASKTKHMSHGLMRFASGKMSSRMGNVVPASSLIDEIKGMVLEKMKHVKEGSAPFKPDELDAIADMVAIAAIKYTVLRQSVGSDVIFDSAKSISFEGDSGPYLQYSAVRAKSILEKAEKEGVEAIKFKVQNSKSKVEVKSEKVKEGEAFGFPEKVTLLEKLIVRLPDIAERARVEFAPQLIANYLINLAGEFNSFYAKQIIVDKKDPMSPYYVALTEAFLKTITDGLWLLGIKVPERM